MPKMIALSEKSNSDILEVGDGESGISIDSDSIEHAKKSGKSKVQKLPKS